TQATLFTPSGCERGRLSGPAAQRHHESHSERRCRHDYDERHEGRRLDVAAGRKGDRDRCAGGQGTGAVAREATSLDLLPAQVGWSVPAAMRVFRPGFTSSTSSSTLLVPSRCCRATVSKRRATCTPGPADVVSYTSSGRRSARGREAVTGSEKYAMPSYQLETT